jgi:hypothetical protein
MTIDAQVLNTAGIATAQNQVPAIGVGTNAKISPRQFVFSRVSDTT